MNIYFTVMAKEENEADAIAEAKKLAEHVNTDFGVSVNTCGTKRHIATVFADGTVSLENTHKPQKE